MPDNIIPFKRPEEKAQPEPPKERWLEGPAQCLHCQHTWVAEAPAGTTELECPRCHTHKGIFTYLVETANGTPRWHCKCEGFRFELRLDGAMCCNCGHLALWPDLMEDMSDR